MLDIALLVKILAPALPVLMGLGQKAIYDMGGVGKSALAIHVAHRLKARFPDAQLYLNLYGQTPESALTPKKALILLLQALTGGDESQLATDLDGLVAQY